jgi:hypothetical protein
VKKLKHIMLGALLDLEVFKSARGCGAKHISKLKWYKSPHVRTTFGRSSAVFDVVNFHF